MQSHDFFQTLTSLYPQNADLCLEIRPLLPEWQKEDMPEEDVRAVHASVRRWYDLAPQYLCNAANYAQGYADTFDVYFGVLPRTGRGGGQSDVWGAGVLFCDVDGGDDGIPGAIQRVKQSGLPLPNLSVVSGGGTHCYWLLREVVEFESHSDREVYKAVLRRLCRVIGGESPAAHADFSACECARILRVPNTFNHKHQTNARAVKVIRNAESERLDYYEWRSLLPRETIEKMKSHWDYSAYDHAGTLSDGLRNWAKQGYPQGKRHQDLAGAAAWLLRDCNVHPDDAIILLRTKAHNSPGVRTITDRELENMIRWASR